MHQNLWLLCELLRELNPDLKITLLSTGLLLKVFAADVVKWCDEVIISLDGSRDVHNAIRRVPRGFERMAEGIAALREQQVDLICLAGYMRLLSPCFVEAFRGRILNIHPSLLPAFPGLDAQRQALEHGAKVSGCTVHFVDETLDGGPIIAQREVPVLEGDTVETLSARILDQEHQLYPDAVASVFLAADLRR